MSSSSSSTQSRLRRLGRGMSGGERSCSICEAVSTMCAATSGRHRSASYWRIIRHQPLDSLTLRKLAFKAPKVGDAVSVIN